MIVTDQYEPMVGGVPTVTRELAGGLAGRGHAVAVIAPSATRHGSQAGGPADRMAGGLAVDYRGSVPWPWYEGQRLGFLPPARAGELIAAFGPDVVHLHSPLTLGVAARTAARRRGVPAVYTNHYLPLNVWPAAAARPAPGTAARVRDAAFYAFVTGFANRCDLVTAPTATALRLLRGHGLRAPSQAVSNGVDLGRFAPGPPDEALRSAYAAAAGPAGHPVGRQAQPGEARGRAHRGGGQARRYRNHGARDDRAGDAARSSCSPGRAPTSAGCGPSPATTGSRTGSGSPASSPTATCPACTGSPTCSPSRRRPSCSPW